MFNSKKEIKMQKEMIDLLAKGEKIYHDAQINFYGSKCLMRLITFCYINPSSLNEIKLLGLDMKGYKVVETIEQLNPIKQGRKTIKLLVFKTGNIKVKVNSAFLTFFDKNAEFQILNDVSSIRVYECGKLVGVMMPIK